MFGPSVVPPYQFHFVTLSKLVTIFQNRVKLIKVRPYTWIYMKNTEPKDKGNIFLNLNERLKTKLQKHYIIWNIYLVHSDGFWIKMLTFYKSIANFWYQDRDKLDQQLIICANILEDGLFKKYKSHLFYVEWVWTGEKMTTAELWLDNVSY